MQTFTYVLTDLTEFRSDPITLDVETDEEAVSCGARIAREMLAQMPHILSLGLCVAVFDADGEQISVVPVDPVN
jgi:hypothetical protein